MGCHSCATFLQDLVLSRLEALSVLVSGDRSQMCGPARWWLQFDVEIAPLKMMCRLRWRPEGTEASHQSCCSLVLAHFLLALLPKQAVLHTLVALRLTLVSGQRSGRLGGPANLFFSQRPGEGQVD